jgi:hypothetical protein
MMAVRKWRVLAVKFGVSDEAQGRRVSRKAQSPRALVAWDSRDGEQDSTGSCKRKSTDGSWRSRLVDSWTCHELHILNKV